LRNTDCFFRSRFLSRLGCRLPGRRGIRFYIFFYNPATISSTPHLTEVNSFLFGNLAGKRGRLYPAVCRRLTVLLFFRNSGLFVSIIFCSCSSIVSSPFIRSLFLQ